MTQLNSGCVLVVQARIITVERKRPRHGIYIKNVPTVCRMEGNILDFNHIVTLMFFPYVLALPELGHEDVL